jgi:hypothetical protein
VDIPVPKCSYLASAYMLPDIGKPSYKAENHEIPTIHLLMYEFL